MIDLSVSEEQRGIVDGAAALLRRRCPVSRLRPGAPAADLHAALADWGWFGIGLPEALGGAGLGIAEEVLLYIEAGRFLLPPGVLATTLAVRLADAELRGALLEGRRHAAMVMASNDGKAYCFDRGEAAVLVMIGVNENALFPASAFHGERLAGLDETVLLEKGHLQADRHTAVEYGCRGVLLTAAMLVGIAKASCELAVEYAKTRQQFGQPIGAFQAVKHRCADMAVNAYAAEAQLLMAAASVLDDVQNSPFQIAAAARTAMAAARSNGASAIQVHGGMGFTAECDAHLYLKRAHLLERLMGGMQTQHRWLLACPAPDRT